MRPEEKVYKAFYEQRKKALPFNQIKKLSGLSDSSLDSTLKKLVSRKLLKKEYSYDLKNLEIATTYFIRFDIERFQALHRNVYYPLQEFISLVHESIAFVILFGSASRKKETRRSDIDLLVVLPDFPENKFYGKFIETHLKKVIFSSNALCPYPLSVVTVTLQKFKVADDHLINQARVTGFPILGHQRYYREVLPREDKRIFK